MNIEEIEKWVKGQMDAWPSARRIELKKEDAIALIYEVKRLTADLEKATRERDAAIDDMEYIAGNETHGAKCNRCKWNPNDTGCELDGSQFEDDGECHFEWSGLKGE